MANVRRLFLALDLPESAIEQLARLQHGLSGVHWTKTEQLHLTLHFMAEVEREREESLLAALDIFELPSSQSTIEPTGITHFATGRSGFVLALLVEKCQYLTQLHKELSYLLNRSGIHSEHRAFRPHITLGRCKSLHPTALSHYLEDKNEYRYESFTPESLTLYFSRLLPDGPLHDPIMRIYCSEGQALG